MGKVKATKSKATKRFKHRDANGTREKPPADPSVLLAEASEFLQTGNLEKALKLATEAMELSATYTQFALPALNLLAQVEIELGDEDAARRHFHAAVKLDPEGREAEELGGGAEKFLWLAQLSEDGGQDSIHWFERGGTILEREIAQLQDVMGAEEEIAEKKAKLTSALCGMAEVWMTDLSLEDGAEAMCEKLITQALLISDPPLPSTLQTLASIRISQSNFEAAQSALQRSMEGWKDLPPQHPDIPDFPARISLARLLMETELLEDAFEVIERLISEDDQSVEAWYLGGWCLWLQGEGDELEDEKAEDEVVDKDVQKALLLSARIWLKNCLQLFDHLEYEDNRLGEHAQQMVTRLDERLGDEEIEDDDEEGWEDDEHASDEDHEMDGM